MDPDQGTKQLDKQEIFVGMAADREKVRDALTPFEPQGGTERLKLQKSGEIDT
jgi:hypothetical protein